MSREQQQQLPHDRSVHHRVSSDTPPPPLNLNKGPSPDNHAPTIPLGGSLSHFFSDARTNIWSPTTTLHSSPPSSATAGLASNVGLLQHSTLHPQQLQQQPQVVPQEQQQYFHFMQDDVNSFENGHQNLADSLQSLTPEQEQHFLNLLQAQWLQQQQPQSLDPSYNLLPSVNTQVNSSASNYIGMNTASPIMPMANQTAAGPNQRSYSVSQDYFGDVNAAAGSASSGSSGSLHRSSSDLGTRINSNHMDFGDFSDRDHSVGSDNISQALSHLYNNQRQLGQFTVTSPASTLSNGSDNSFAQYLIENSTKSCLPSVGSGLPDARPLDQSELILNSQEISGFGSEKLHRAPGTPLSPTPPPKFSATSAADSSSVSSLQNGSLKSQTSNTSNSTDSLNSSSTSGAKGRRNKKGKTAAEFNAVAKQHQPAALQKQKPSPDVTSSQNKPQELPTPSPPLQVSSLFYSSDPNPLLEKMGNLSSSFVNWISSDKSRSSKPTESGQSKDTDTSFETQPSSSTGSQRLPNKTRSEVNSQKASSGSCDKLSYSDVLSNSKIASDKSPNGEQSSFQSTGQLTENNSAGSRRMKCSDNQSTSPLLQSQSQNSYRKSQVGYGQPPPPSSPYLNKKSPKPTLTFGTRVGLDEFTIPTLEELTQSSSRRNSSLLSSDISTASGKANDSTQNMEASQPPTPNCGTKKSKGNPSAGQKETNALLNNNNKVQSLKHSLKKSSFINNLSETSPSSSGAESNSGAGPASLNGQRQQSTSGRAAHSESSSHSTDAEDVTGSDKDSSSRAPSTQQSSPQHSRTGGGRGYGPGGNSSGVGITRFRGNSSKGKAGKNSNSNNRKRKEADNSTSEWQAQLTVLVAACLVYVVSAARWLYHLVLEVAEMSAALVWTAWVWGRANGELHGLWLWALAKRYWAKLLEKCRFWRNKGSKKRMSREAHYLEQHIPLPATGEEAMKRLLACRGLDNYSVLGVTPDATQEDIRRYYRRQAFLVHPDKNKTMGAEEAFKVLGHAFEEIGEPAKREEYDKRVLGESQLGEAWDKLADLLKDLERKLEEAANMIRCTSCPNKHRRVKVPDRPVYAARYCDQCNIRHPAKEGDIWAESWYWGLRWQYFACMDGTVYDISEWAACQASNLKQLKANTHAVQYRIVAGKKKTSRDQHKPPHDMPTEPEIEEFFNQLYRDKFSSSFPPPPSPASPPSSQAGEGGINNPPASGGGKRRDARGSRRNRR